MANDICKMTVSGRLTKDAEITYTNGGGAICKFALASNYSRKKGDQYVDEVSYFDCVMFGRRAEALHRYLTKGKQILLETSPRQERWEKDGQKRSAVRFYVDQIVLTSGGQSSGSPRSTDPRNAPYGTQPEDIGYQGPGSGAGFEDEIPFK